MAVLSEADKQYLNADQQKQIAALKDKWAAATTQEARDAANKAANEIRAQAAGGGYSGGSDGSGYVPTAGQPQQVGGQSAADVAKWVQEYEKANQGYNSQKGFNTWNNGYSTAMNLRSQANYIRQQMDANSKAWADADAATREYLHDQNQQLAKILEQASGGAQSTYNPTTGRWETYNSNLGYGTDMNYVDQYIFDPEFRSKVYGQTEADWEKYRNDTDRYYNFVDTRTVRNWNDESNGFTGEYAQFVNGPYRQLMGNYSYVPRSTYVDVIGDGFNERDYNPANQAEAPALKYNNQPSDYTRDKMAYTENGIIMPNVLNGSKSPSAAGNNYLSMQGSGPNYADSVENWPTAWRSDDNDMTIGGQGWLNQMSSRYGGSGGVGGSGGLDGYLNSLYDANLQSQLAQLQMAYNTNLAELDKTLNKTNAEYDEQKRQTQGNSERSAANWRELALAQGLNTGAIGQAALSQNNQLQSNLNTLGAAQAQNLANIEQQRALLGQQYQLQILQAQADNDFERAQALYNEAVRQDEILREQQAQQQAFMQELLLKSMGSSSGGSRSSGSGGGGPGVATETDARLNYDAMMAAAQASGDPEGWLSSKTNRALYGFGDWSATEVKDYYNDRYAPGLNNVGVYNNVILADPTKSVEDKTKLAYENFDRGDITYSQLQSILNQLGTGA